MHSNCPPMHIQSTFYCTLLIASARFSYVGLFFSSLNCCVIDCECNRLWVIVLLPITWPKEWRQTGRWTKNENQRVENKERPTKTCPRSKMSINQTIQTVSLSSTVPFLDYLMFYVYDSLSTRPINSIAASLEAHKMCINLLRYRMCVSHFLDFQLDDISLAESLVLECFFAARATH